MRTIRRSIRNVLVPAGPDISSRCSRGRHTTILEWNHNEPLLKSHDSYLISFFLFDTNRVAKKRRVGDPPEGKQLP